MLNYSTGSPLAGGPTPEHLEQIARARVLGKKVRRAQGVAAFSAWTTAIFATATIIFSITSLWGLALGACMAVVSIIEFRGMGELKRLDPTAPKRLALNQLAFGSLLFFYGAISLWQSFHDPSGTMAQITKEFGGMDGMNDMETVKTLQYFTKVTIIAVYGGVMVAAVVGPGLTALYYYTRKRYIDEYVSQTPRWILDLQRAGMSL